MWNNFDQVYIREELISQKNVDLAFKTSKIQENFSYIYLFRKVVSFCRERNQRYYLEWKLLAANVKR